MKVLNLIKRLRNSAVEGGTCMRVLGDFASGAVLACLTGPLNPRIRPEEGAKHSLIICPSPLLNGQEINLQRRRDYVISFVNRACLSPTFQVLRPERFFLIDPAFFQPKNLIKEEGARNGAEQTIREIAMTTTWPMTVYVPWHYRKSEKALWMATNRNVRIHGIPVFSSKGGVHCLKNIGFRLGIFNPVYQNVLIAAIFFSLKAGHKRVFVWGAHHTWLKEVEVDEENRVLHSVRHSHAERKGEQLFNYDGTPRRYHVYLQQLSVVFEQYHVLRDFAERNGTEIINVAEESFIDAFRKTREIDLFSPGAANPICPE